MVAPPARGLPAADLPSLCSREGHMLNEFVFWWMTSRESEQQCE